MLLIPFFSSGIYSLTSLLLANSGLFITNNPLSFREEGTRKKSHQF